MKNISLYADAQRLEACIRALKNQLEMNDRDLDQSNAMHQSMLDELLTVKKRVVGPTNEPWGVTMSVTEGFLLIAALSRAGSMPGFRAEILNAIGKVISDEQRRLT